MSCNCTNLVVCQNNNNFVFAVHKLVHIDVLMQKGKKISYPFMHHKFYISPKNQKLITTLIMVLREISGEYIKQVCTSLEACL